MVAAEYGIAFNTAGYIYFVVCDSVASAFAGRTSPIGAFGSGSARVAICTFAATGPYSQRIYLDGVRVDTADVSTGVYVRMRNTAYNVIVGGPFGSGFVALNGNITLPTIFDYALSPLQVRSLTGQDVASSEDSMSLQDFISRSKSLQPALFRIPLLGNVNAYDSYNRATSFFSGAEGPVWREDAKGFWFGQKKTNTAGSGALIIADAAELRMFSGTIFWTAQRFSALSRREYCPHVLEKRWRRDDVRYCTSDGRIELISMTVP